MTGLQRVLPEMRDPGGGAGLGGEGEELPLPNHVALESTVPCLYSPETLFPGLNELLLSSYLQPLPMYSPNTPPPTKSIPIFFCKHDGLADIVQSVRTGLG